MAARRDERPGAGPGMMAGMRISARADYAIRVPLELAADTSRPITCAAVASAQDIPARFIKAVMSDLRQAGLVTVRDVVVVVDGEFLSVRGEPRPAPAYHGTAAGLTPRLRSQARRTSARDHARQLA
ncbi:Rrf2 family transcriptional regulator [Amycolatopsis sp. NPDC004378]